MRSEKEYFANQPINVDDLYNKSSNTYFNLDCIESFDGRRGKVIFKRHYKKQRMSFNSITSPYEKSDSWEFPPVYDVDEKQEFYFRVLENNTLHIKINSKNHMNCMKENPMIVKKFDEIDCDMSFDEDYIYSFDQYKIIVKKNPFDIVVINKAKNIKIFSLYNSSKSSALDNTYPNVFGYSRDSMDFSRRSCISIQLQYNESIYGLGESFTRINKRGQKLNLFAYDALGVENKDMYKPIPFFMSSMGYGVFINNTCPITVDVGNSYNETLSIYQESPFIDFYVFLGNYKEILNSYTTMTGKSFMVPDWSFGLWMSRITYDNQYQVENVAKKLREYNIPCDVIHIDTGWFEEDWKCDYKFSTSRFKDISSMIRKLKENDFKISLWQLPYFTPGNRLFEEIIDKELCVKDVDGGLPTEDAILDFSNPKTVSWYQSHIKKLLSEGADSIKVDFGEAAPINGLYYSGLSGKYEHNLYPLRYNKCVSDITFETTGERIIWARSTWAGSQRYGIHWGGDSETSYSAMASSLRGGLSLGACGFSFWSHDIGGFTKVSPKELYLKWLAFGAFTSHSRCHGQPPKEPWEFGDDFMDKFRSIIEIKYKLFPYIKSEALKSCSQGLPMIRAMFIEYPNDKICENIDDQYFFGEKILVAPIFTEQNSRDVYLPDGEWVNFFDKDQIYKGGLYYKNIKCGEIPILAFVRRGDSILMSNCIGNLSHIDRLNIVENYF